MKILDKINNWTQSGPAGNDLRQNGWDIEDLISYSIQGDISGLAQESGFVEGVDAGDAFESDWGQYLHPYEVEGERMAVAAFEQQQQTQLTEGITQLWSAYSTGGRTGFGTSYGATNLVDTGISQTGSAIGLARKAKDQAIFKRREDWVDSLWDTMAELADLGAFGE